MRLSASPLTAAPDPRARFPCLRLFPMLGRAPWALPAPSTPRNASRSASASRCSRPTPGSGATTPWPSPAHTGTC